MPSRSGGRPGRPRDRAGCRVTEPEPAQRLAAIVHGRVHGVGFRVFTLRTARELFYRHGIHSVGIDRIIAESGVAKMTFYRHFPSKGRLIEEYLAQNEQNWQNLVAQVTSTAKTPVAKLLAIFDGLECAIKDPGFCGCPFIKALAEFGLTMADWERMSRTPLPDEQNGSRQ